MNLIWSTYSKLFLVIVSLPFLLQIESLALHSVFLVLLCFLWTSKIQKWWKQIKAAWQLLPEMNETPFRIIFRINDTKIYTNSDDLVAANCIDFHVWTTALEGIYHGDKIGIFAFDSGNILNMFEIQKYINKISQIDEYLHSKIHCLTLDLLCTAVWTTIFFFRFVFALKLVYFSKLLGFEYAYLCLYIRLNL